MLNWGKFCELPGAKFNNFELVCRSVIRQFYAEYGDFRALSNQPGVEFHLNINKACPLGDIGRWFGWQCKWHEPNQNGSLKAATKRDIEDSLNKTKTYLPNITDWVLWVPYQLVKDDQKWYFGLGSKTNFNLHLYTDVELEEYLNSGCPTLKRSYFGDLAITEEELAALHSRNVKPIERRWFKDVHIESDIEFRLRRMLGEHLAWSDLSNTLTSLKSTIELIDVNSASLSQIEGFKHLTHNCNLYVQELAGIELSLRDKKMEEVNHLLFCWSCDVSIECYKYVRKLRRINHPCALHITNALADMAYAGKVVKQLKVYLGKSLIAVLSEAGGGKTQLAAQLTSPIDGRPAGVLILGQWLGRGSSLNNLAQRCSIGSIAFHTFEDLLSCLDSAAKRARTRLPLVIDGLSEAENPKDWKTELEILSSMLKDYPNVLVICTLRTSCSMQNRLGSGDNKESFAEVSLPEEDIMERLILDGFGIFTEGAIRDYCKYYRIKTDLLKAPVDFFRRPLNLFIFCEVTNPGRSREVTVTHFPNSLVSIFNKYIEYACDRICGLKNLSYSYRMDELISYINILGIALWEAGSRHILESDFKSRTDDTRRSWDSSIVNLLSQEGIIFRDSVDGFGNFSISPAYDSLGGFIVAKSLLLSNSTDHEFKWLNENEVSNQFIGENTHDLAYDVFSALVALTPMIITGCQLWKGDHGLREAALRLTPEIEPDYLDDETTQAFIGIFTIDPQKEKKMLGEFRKMRCIPKHKLNANALNGILTSMTMSNRDLSWSEWIRISYKELEDEVHKIESIWKEIISHDESDYLLFQWVKWLLTSTVRNLRDYSTRALYWFGRKNPQFLFSETIESVSVNDPYVFERMLASSYGVCMALQTEVLGLEDLRKLLPELIGAIYELLFKESAQYSTSHTLIREYATGIIELSAYLGLCPLTADELNRCRPPYSDMDRLDWQEYVESPDDRKYPNSPIHMDFGNYTIGRLAPGRRNYDSQHKAYRTILSQILWRIQELGWSKELFSEIDVDIDKRRNSYRIDQNVGKIDRYGKKYSWIAYFEMAGRLGDFNGVQKSNERTSDIDIDPSFPEPTDEKQLIHVDFLDLSQPDLKIWIETNDSEEFVKYLRVKGLNQDESNWIALDGFFIQNAIAGDRELNYCIRSFIVSSPQGVDLDCLSKYIDIDDLFHFTPGVVYTLSGEIPWSPQYLHNEPVIIHSNNQYDLFGENAAKKGPKNKYNDMKLIRSVCEFEWESYHSVTNQAKGTIPCKQICSGLDLVIIPQTLNMGTREGEVVTQNLSYSESSWRNTQDFLFVREDYLKQFLEAGKIQMVWILSCKKNAKLSDVHDNVDYISSDYHKIVTIKDLYAIMD
jgi:hypothetical protein